ncbi:glycoside hydrolase family 76 protein [Corynebacterium halotolerans]|uniref:Glycoside hydrolase n=1 Tax=Corynebacterium halotolerans YIM 70093 = DSM 44683 TaxID=1121362 RepID=M1P156_9CORY|nr:glycoside hydrolase family 76 protein [Corynebacterium halotolerans]AGF73510.1 glycoside hydrolase [Corynebacterium halotolerans YIM 70093 = DSM 44683]
MLEKWAHRADLAEAAINDRHASRVWGIPRTNLAVVSWPPTTKEKLFFHWHYWWQAHYLDCLIDAARRRTTQGRRDRIRETIRGIRLRNLGKLTSNLYYDDKAWLTLALARAGRLSKIRRPKVLDPLEQDIMAGIDGLTGVLPWRKGETFYNVPSNGPSAIMMARTGRLDQAVSIVDWIFDHLIDDDGLVMDGLRMRMHGPELVRDIHPYCQGVVLGACLEIALKLRERAGFGHDEKIEGYDDAVRADDSMPYLIHVRSIVQSIASYMATPAGVIDWETGEGDGGLFKGILARYLADVAVRLPTDSPANRATRKIAARLVTASAESVWNHRLEVDGLPVFATDWTADARLPHNYSLGPSTLPEAIGMVRIAERDLSVQLSGWMLLEAAARVAGESETERRDGRE